MDSRLPNSLPAHDTVPKDDVPLSGSALNPSCYNAGALWRLAIMFITNGPWFQELLAMLAEKLLDTVNAPPSRLNLEALEL